MIEVVIALITGGFSIIAVILTNRSANNKMISSMHTAQAVTDEKIKELTREVRAHNEFAQRIPAIEIKIVQIEKQISELQKLHQRQ